MLISYESGGYYVIVNKFKGVKGNQIVGISSIQEYQTFHNNKFAIERKMDHFSIRYENMER